MKFSPTKKASFNKLFKEEKFERMISFRRISIILSLVFSFFLVNPVFAVENFASAKPTSGVKFDINAPTLPVNTLKIEANVTQAEVDQREVTLFNYLSKHNSPLAAYTADFIRVADKYDLDYRFLPAISGLESGFGVALPYGSHNPFGWGPSIRFASFPDAFETVGNGIRTRYVKTGKVTPFMVGPTYAASPTWAVRVNSFMLQIDNSPI